MPATIAVHEVHPDLPVDRVWQAGRRLYARCGRDSRLSHALNAMGAKWDTKEKALWVGSGKRDQFTSLALDHHAILTRVQQVRDAGHWVKIPFDAVLIRARAKELGGIWDPTVKRWALPTPADQMEIIELVQVWERAREAEREQRRREREAAWTAARREAEAAAREAALESAGVREQQRRQAVRKAAEFREALASGLGRALTGQVEIRREVFPRYTDRQAAQEMACEVGQVLRLEDGRRGLVTDRRIRYVPADRAQQYGQDRAHLSVQYELAVVAPTGEELDAEVARAAQAMDARELYTAVSDATLITFPVAGDHWTPIPDPEGSITVSTGVNGLIPAGRLILARDGMLWWQHPGHYDDYVRAEGCTGDGDLVAAVRDLLAAGPRRRVVPGDPPLHYEVTVNA